MLINMYCSACRCYRDHTVTTLSNKVDFHIACPNGHSYRIDLYTLLMQHARLLVLNDLQDGLKASLNY